MSLGLWMGLAVCVAGLGFQFFSVREISKVDGGEGEGSMRDHFRGEEGEILITKSSRGREVSKRKIISPFDSPNGLVLRFLEGDSVARNLYPRRKALVQEVMGFRRLGLGRRHPDVIGRSEESEQIEKELMAGWARWRAQDTRRGSERMRSVGR